MKNKIIKSLLLGALILVTTSFLIKTIIEIIILITDQSNSAPWYSCIIFNTIYFIIPIIILLIFTVYSFKKKK